MNKKRMSKGIVMGFALLIVLSAISMVMVTTEVVVAEILYPAEGEFTGGTGNYTDPFLIENWTHLNNVRDYPSYSFALNKSLSSAMDDYLDYNDPATVGWEPIDNFGGTFDGLNYTIDDLFINRPAESGTGLFAFVGGGLIPPDIEFRSVHLRDVNITGANNTGALVGGLINGLIKDCSSTGIVTGVNHVGGLMGYGNDVNMYYSKSDCNVTGGNYVGGLVGFLYKDSSSNVYESLATGKVIGEHSVGGFAGGVEYATIHMSYGAGDVEGNTSVGGFVGNLNYGNVYETFGKGDVIGLNWTGGYAGYMLSVESVDAYAHGNITRPAGADGEWFGGFVGFNERSYIKNGYSVGSVYYEGVDNPTDKGFVGYINTANPYDELSCFWDSEASNQATTIGNSTAENTSNMMDVSTFSLVGWDIAVIPEKEYDRAPEYTWNIEQYELPVGSYPFLSWESVEGVRPTVTTGPALDVTSTGTTLHATVDLGTTDNVTLYWWYIDIDFEEEIRFSDNITVEDSGSFNATVTGLTPDTEYIYQATIEWDETGGAEGDVLSFFTGIIFPDGDGSEGNPYIIQNWHHLNAVRNYLDSHFLLANNLTADTIGYDDYNNESTSGWLPIGTTSYMFNGYLNGSYYTIDGIYINRPTTGYIGLFGRVGIGEVSYLEVTNVDIAGGYYVGGIVGYNDNGLFTAVGVTGSVTASWDSAGGFVGRNLGSIIISYADVEVVAFDWDVGGFAGSNSYGTIVYSYARGNVTGDIDVGGFIGYLFQGTIIHCYSTGLVNANAWYGGFVGYGTIEPGFEIANFWDIETSGTNESVIGTGLTTEQAKAFSTYDGAGWDILDIPSFNEMDTDYVWNIMNTVTYPVLTWQSLSSVEETEGEEAFPPAEEDEVDEVDEDEDTSTPVGATNSAVRILLAFIPIVIVVLVLGKIIIPMLDDVGDDVER